MLESKIKHQLLKDIAEVTGTVKDEVKFSFDEDGLTIRAVDPSHIAMIEMNIPKEEFVELKFSENTSYGVDLKKLKETLKMGKGDEIVEMSLSDENNKLLIKFGSIKRVLPLIDENVLTDTKTPSLKYNSVVSVKSKVVLEGIKAAGLVSRHATLSINPEGMDIIASEEIDQISYNIVKDAIQKISCDEKMESTYSLDYLGKMMHVVPSENLSISLNNDYPLTMEFTIGNEGKVKYLLAPKVRE